MPQHDPISPISSDQGLALLEVLLALALAAANLLALLTLITHSLDSSQLALAAVLTHQAEHNERVESRLQSD